MNSSHGTVNRSSAVDGVAADEAGDGAGGGDVVGELGRVEAALVEHGAADVADGDDAHAGRRQQEGERSADLAEALDDDPPPGERHAELGEAPTARTPRHPVDVAPAWACVPPIDSGLPVTIAGLVLAGRHRRWCPSATP